MGLVDWNNDGVRGYEIGRAGMIASSWMDEADGGGSGYDGGGCGAKGCLILLVGIVVLFLLLTGFFNLLYALFPG